MSMTGPAGGISGGMMQGFPSGGFGGIQPLDSNFPGFGSPGNRLTAGDIEARTQRLKITNATELARSIEKALPKAKTLKVVPEPTSNTIIIVADTGTMKDVLRIIEEHDGKDAPGAGGIRSSGTRGARPPAGAGGVPGRAGARGGEGADSASRPGAGASGGTGTVRGSLPPRGAEELKVFVLKHAKAQDLVPVVERIFRTADFTAETRTNQLIVRGNAETLMEVTALLEKLDVELPRR
jgi:type II secretory pathway component GspD/PulD (secretin)